MKSLYVGLILIIIFYGAGVMMTITLDKYLDAAYDMVGEIEDATRNEDWDKVNILVSELTAYWPDKHTTLAYFIDHEELDQIEFAIARIDGELILEDKFLLFPEIVGLRKIIEQVKGKYSLKLCNII